MPIDRKAIKKLSNSEYHRRCSVSKSHLDKVNQSPLHFWHHYLDPNRPEPERTKAMILGSAFHTKVLEPHLFDKEYYVEPDNAPKRPTFAQLNAKKPSAQTLEAIEYWTSFDALLGKKTLLLRDDFFKLEQMEQAVRKHKAANLILSQKGKVEQSYEWTDETTNERCRCRPDFHTDDHLLVVDLKTTEDASPRGFQSSISKFRYHVQSNWYLRGVENSKQFVFIAVEKKPPYMIGVYKASIEMCAAGGRAADKNLRLLSECRKDDSWPGYSEAIEEIDLPKWNND
tara:strand:+ start:3877 stop:4731 length:855 start_codon:yes stop_codon:yes gene_type:complete